MRKILTILTFSVFYFLPIPYLHAKDVNGTISTSVTWSGEIHITSDVFVTSAAIVTIKPGTVVKADGYYGIHVEESGRIMAQGTAEEPVTFTTNDATGFVLDDASEAGAWFGIAFRNMKTDPDSSVFAYCSFSYAKKNTTPYGGAIAAYGSTYDTDRNWLSIFECDFTNCRSQAGGAVYLHTADAWIANCTFIHNRADYGGAMQFNNSEPNIVSCLIYDNAAITGGGIYMFSTSNARIINCTIVNNTADYAGGFSAYLPGGTPATTVSARLYNTIIRDNTASTKGDNYGGAQSVFFNCNVEGGIPDGINSSDYTNCIDADPLFTNAAGGDFSLQQESPCKETGTITGLLNVYPPNELSGYPRIQLATVDMGAYEVRDQTGNSDGYAVKIKIVDKDNDPVPGILLEGVDEVARTDRHGECTLELYTGWRGSITPTSSLFAFNPLSIEVVYLYHDLDEGITAIEGATPVYVVTGQVTNENDEPMSNINIDGFDNDVTTDDEGWYALCLGEGWSGTIAPIVEDYTFTPEELTITSLSEDISRNFSGTIVIVTGIDPLEETAIVSVYPNPTPGVFHIDLLRFSQVKIFDLTGKIFFDQPLSDVQKIVIGEAGTYIIQINDGEHIYYTRVVVQ